MSVMKAIKQAWASSAKAVNGHHSYDQIPADSRKKEFIKRLYRLPQGLDTVIMTLWYEVGTVSDEYNSFKRESRHEIEQITGKLEQKSKVCNKYVDQIEMINARRNVLTNTIESMGKAMMLTEISIEDLESSLVTARYFIFLGSMCGFLLGIACLFLVV
jgi:archaellum component FlaC